MIIIINGPLGIGKSTISEALLEPLSKQNKKIWLLDVDHLMVCSPALDKDFGPKHYEYLTRLVSHNINFHRENGFDCFIINYVFPQQQELADLMLYLYKNSAAAASGGIFSFCLWTHHTSLLQLNVNKRKLPNLEWELKRCVELHHQMAKSIPTKKLGDIITIHDEEGKLLTPEAICKTILSKIDVIINPKTTLESIDVSPKFIDWILDRTKTATTRKFKVERNMKWKAGDHLLAINSETKKPFAVLRLGNIQSPKFGELTTDLAKIEHFESLDEFKKVLREIYPDIETFGDDTLMHVFYFTAVHYLL